MSFRQITVFIPSMRAEDAGLKRKKLAEREGFEPPEDWFRALTRFRVVRHQPNSATSPRKPREYSIMPMEGQLRIGDLRCKLATLIRNPYYEAIVTRAPQAAQARAVSRGSDVSPSLRPQ